MQNNIMEALVQPLAARLAPGMRACLARAQLVSLAAFRPAPAPSASGARSKVSKSRGGLQLAHARRPGNVFLNPGKADESLTSLYGSGRFNDDDGGVAPPEPTSPDAAAGPGSDSTADAAEAAGASPAGAAAGLKELPAPRGLKVKSAEFIKSSVQVGQCPPEHFPEFALIGRSNVGKSSMINLLTDRKSLALVSKTPGKTRCINHFLINGSWYLVDLPGYGYARASKENILGWNDFTRDYFLQRQSLAAVLLLIDASIPPVKLDLAVADWFGEHEIPFTLVFTKSDKAKKGVPPAEENIAAFEAALGESWEALPPAVVTSARSGAGKRELLAHVAQLRALWNAGRAAG